MQRRQFLGALSAPTFSIAPKWQKIGESSKCCKAPPFQCASSIAEVRVYEGLPGGSATLITLHKKHGIETFEQSALTFVSSFDSLEQRGAAWNSLAADTAWHTFRDERKLQLVSLAIYERLGSSDWDASTA